MLLNETNNTYSTVHRILYYIPLETKDPMALPVDIQSRALRWILSGWSLMLESHSVVAVFEWHRTTFASRRRRHRHARLSPYQGRLLLASSQLPLSTPATLGPVTERSGLQRRVVG